MNSRYEIMRKLHDEGISYEKIGQYFGISKQAVHQKLNRGPTNHFHEGSVRKVKYIGLRDWMLNNRITMTKLEELCGISKSYKSLAGSYQPSKKTIDAILAVTGLTYEECFKEEPK